MRNINVLVVLLTVHFSSGLYSQGNLQFNRALTVVNSMETVPVGKVWKVVSLIGIRSECINAWDEFHIKNISDESRNKTWFTLTDLLIDGTRFYAYASIMEWRNPSYGMRWWANTADCITTSSSGSEQHYPPRQTPVEPNPNSFPIWLSEGTTIQTGGSSVRASVIEFNVMP